MKSAPAIGFDYRPSRLVAVSVVVAGMFALLALAFCGLPWWSKLALMIAAGVQAGLSLRNFLRSPCRHLQWHEAGHWRIHHADGRELAAELRRATVLGGVIVLSFRIAFAGKTPVALLPDNSDADIRRRLRVRLVHVHETSTQHT